MLAAVALGAFGAVGGTWLGWQTAAAVPSDRELRTLNVAMTGLPGDAALYSGSSAMKAPNTLVRADGTGSYSAARIRSALSSAGWRITSFDERQGATIADPQNVRPEEGTIGVPIATMFVYCTATKGGLKLNGDGSVITGGAERALAGQAGYATAVWPREAAAVRPLTIAGLIAGAIAGWLLAAALAYRVRGSARSSRWVAAALFTAAFASAAIPVFAHYRDAYQVMVYAHGSPYPYIVYGADDEMPVLTCTVIGLLAVVAVRTRREPATVIVTV